MTIVDEEYLTIAKACEFLQVSRSTIWRWIDREDLPAYRIGRRRVLVRKDDLRRLINPARSVDGSEGGETLEQMRERLSRPLTKQEKAKALAALEAAREFSAQMRERQGGQLFSDSTEIIREMREERTRQLS